MSTVLPHNEGGEGDGGDGDPAAEVTGDRLQAWNVTLWSIDIPHDYPPRLRFMGPDGAVLLAFDHAARAIALVNGLADVLAEIQRDLTGWGGSIPAAIVNALTSARAAGWRPAEERGDGDESH